jgi:hypothetical protein
MSEMTSKRTVVVIALALILGAATVVTPQTMKGVIVSVLKAFNPTAGSEVDRFEEQAPQSKKIENNYGK